MTNNLYLLLIALTLFISNIGAVSSFVNSVIGILGPVLIGILIACILNNQIDHVNKKVKNNILSVIFVYVTVILFIILVIILVLPNLVANVLDLANNLSTNGTIKDFELFITKLIADYNLGSFTENILRDLSLGNLVQNLVNPVASAIIKYSVDAVSFFIKLGMSLFIAIGISINRSSIMEFITVTTEHILKDKAHHLLLLLNRIYTSLSGYIFGRLVDSLIIGIATALILYLLRIPYWLLVSVIVGITNIVPVLGPLVGCIIGLILTVLISPIHALIFFIVSMVEQWIDGNLLGPVIAGKSIGIPSFLTFISIVVLGNLAGAVGIIVGVPIFAAIYMFIQDWYLEIKKSHQN